MKAVVITAFIIYVFRECQQQETLILHKCTANADIMYRQCCVFPPFFTREVARECGAEISLDFFDEKNNVSGSRRINYDCTHWYCVLSKYSLTTTDAYVDIDKYFSHLDVWVSLNPLFADPMIEARVYCKDEFRPTFPLHVCEFFNFQECIRNYITVECPIYIQSPECDQKKEFLRECKQYFHKK